jgi:DNA-directed RNA polymerase specialized sigma subunit
MKKVSVNLDILENNEKQLCRQRIDLLQSRAALLTGKDKTLMEMYFANGNSFRQMAAVAGVNETTIARRIYTLTKRLIDGQYITCLRNKGRLDDMDLKVAKDYFLGGLAQQKIADKQKISKYRVRKILTKIQAIIKVSKIEGQK